ncbi:MAG: DUF2165 family protein [Saprospiraceae bacterium]
MINIKPLRLVQISVAALAGIYLLLVGINNVLDYDVNFEFAKQVMSMQDTFPSNDLDDWRSITQLWLIHIFYIGIIILEISGGLFTLKGTADLFKNRYNAVTIFQQKKQFAFLGMLLGLVLWAGIFLIVAGEWFLMWQSATWNAQGTAFNLAILYGVFILILAKEEL